MPVVLDVAVEGLSLTHIGKKRRCDKRTAQSRLMLGVEHYLAARDNGPKGGSPESAEALGEETSDEQACHDATPRRLEGEPGRLDHLPPVGVMLALDPRAALHRAIGLAGGQTKLAEAIGTRQQNISYWLKRGQASVAFVEAIEAATNVPASQLRPDIFAAPHQLAHALPPQGHAPAMATTRVDTRGHTNTAEDRMAAALPDARARWADSTDRCSMCGIVMKSDGEPPSPCYREGCKHAIVDPMESCVLSASSLGSDDFTTL